jgi:hypothetical protein
VSLRDGRALQVLWLSGSIRWINKTAAKDLQLETDRGIEGSNGDIRLNSGKGHSGIKLGFDCYGSIVASSTSMIGMSSFTA